MKGHPNNRISEMLELDSHTVGNYIRTYKRQGIEGLILKKATGQPRFLTKEQERRLFEIICNKTPGEEGFDGIKNWIAKTACL